MIDLGMMLESSRTCLATTKVWETLGLHGWVLTHVLDHLQLLMLFHGVYRSAKHVVQLRPFEGWAFQKDMFTSGWCVVSHRRSEPHSPHCLGLRERNLTEILPLEASRLKASVTSLDFTNIFQCADRIGSPKIIHSRHSKRSSENIVYIFACFRSNKG